MYANVGRMEEAERVEEDEGEGSEGSRRE